MGRQKAPTSPDMVIIDCEDGALVVYTTQPFPPAMSLTGTGGDMGGRYGFFVYERQGTTMMLRRERYLCDADKARSAAVHETRQRCPKEAAAWARRGVEWQGAMGSRLPPPQSRSQK